MAVAWVLCLSPLAVSYGRDLTRDLRWADRFAPWVKEMGEWMAANVAPGQVITGKMSVGYYAQMAPAPFPYGDPGRLAQYAKRWNARYLVLEEQELAHYHPAIREMWERPSSVEAWRLVKQQPSAQEQGWAVFEVTSGTVGGNRSGR